MRWAAPKLRRSLHTLSQPLVGILRRIAGQQHQLFFAPGLQSDKTQSFSLLNITFSPSTMWPEMMINRKTTKESLREKEELAMLPFLMFGSCRGWVFFSLWRVENRSYLKKEGNMKIARFWKLDFCIASAFGKKTKPFFFFFYLIQCSFIFFFFFCIASAFGKKQSPASTSSSYSS